MKKILSMTIMAMIWLLGVCTAHAGKNLSHEYFTYQIEGSYAVITGYTGIDADVIVPAKIDEYQVLIVGEYTFYKNQYVKNVVVPEGIKEIGKYAFCKTGLETIQLPSSLLVIYDCAFAETQLKKIEISGKIQYIGGGVFSDSKQLEEIKIKKPNETSFYDLEGVLYNGMYLRAYPAAKSGAAFEIPNGVLSIHPNTFHNLKYLTEIIVPETVANIYLGAFSYTDHPVNIILKHDKATNISAEAFYHLALGSTITVKNEHVKEKVEKSISGEGVNVAIASIPATSFTYTGATELTLKLDETHQINWSQEPYNTTENVTWQSSDPIGLTIEEYTGLITARKRGSYVVTGKDESGHSVNIQVTVPTVVADMPIEFYLGSGATTASMQTFGHYRIASDQNVFMVAGTIREFSECDGYTYNWSCSKPCYFQGDYYMPYEAGRQTISLTVYDEKGILVGKGGKEVDVVLDNSSMKNISKFSYDIGSQYQYTGGAIEPDFYLFDENGMRADEKFYTVGYKNNIKPGVATVVITGRYMYTGTLNIPFTIYGSNNEKEGQKITATASYTKTYGDKAFRLDAKTSGNGTLTYSSSDTKVISISPMGIVTIKGVGEAAITIKAAETDSYKGATKKVAIHVSKAPLGSCKVSSVAEQGYTGKALTPKVTVTFNGNTLKSGTDYTLSYSNNKKIGTAAITIKGKGSYTGTKKAAFKITAAGQPTGLKLASCSTNKIELSWKKAAKADGYEVFRSTSKNSGYKKIKTLSGNSRANHTDKKLSSGKVYYYKVRAYKTVNGKKAYGSYSSTLTASTKPLKVSLTAKSNGRKGVLSWKTVEGASGYEIYRSTSRNGKYSRIKTLAKGTARSFTDSKLSGNKTYWYKTRAYLVAGKTKVYGAYSDAKGIKTPK